MPDLTEKSRSIDGLKVALINMPLASIDYPSLALGLLKSICEESGYSARTYNFNLMYSRVLGVETYSELTDGRADPLGEQVFAHLIHPDRISNLDFVNYISGCATVGQFLRAVSVADAFVDSCADLILLDEPQVVGFTTTFFQKAASLALAKRLKQRRPKLCVAFGGAACESPMGEALLEIFDCVDVVFHGEAESSFPTFLKNLCESGRRNLEAGKGFSVRGQSGELRYQTQPSDAATLSSIPLPDYHDFVEERSLVFPEDSTEQEWQIPYEISRGCWWGEKNHCTFCGLNALHMKYRKKDIGRIEYHLRRLRSAYGPRTVIFSDNIAPVKIATELAPTLGGIEGFKYFFEVKSNLREDELLAFSRNGIVHIQPGIERLNTSVLKSMRKGNSAAMNILLLRRCAELGIDVVWNYLLGFPAEDQESLYNEVDLLKRLRNLPPPHGVHRVRFDRYSPLFDKSHDFGVSIGDVSDAEFWLFNGHTQRRKASYFFKGDIDPDTERSCSEMWLRISQEIGNWMDTHEPNSLITFGRGKEQVILDFRNTFGKEYLLEGPSAEIFIRARDGLPQAHLDGDGSLFRARDKLLGEGLLVDADGVLVSLPTLVDENAVKVSSPC